MIKYLIILICCLILISCIKDNINSKSDIYISFEKEIIIDYERKCENLDLSKEDFYENIDAKKKDIDYIISEINHLKKVDQKIDDSFNSSFILYIKSKDILICISNDNLIKKNGVNVSSNDSLIYIIKSISRYYNYYDKDYLIHNDRLINKYGLPKDYKKNENQDLVNITTVNLKLKIVN